MSDLKVNGKITSILDVETGTSKAGKEWQKQSFVIDTEAKFNPEVCFSLFGEKTDLLNGLKTGDEVEVSFNVSSREYNGKYYHNLDAWRINKSSDTSTPAEAPQAEVSDLPF